MLFPFYRAQKRGDLAAFHPACQWDTVVQEIFLPYIHKAFRSFQQPRPKPGTTHGRLQWPGDNATKGKGARVMLMNSDHTTVRPPFPATASTSTINNLFCS